MNKIKKNENENKKRRFSIEEKFMKGDKNISKSKPSDVLYGYLQMISTFRKEDQIRFIYKKNYSHINVQEHFGIDENGKYNFERKAVARAFKVLEQYGYIRESRVVGLKGNDVPIYELPYDDDKLFQYIQLDTLRYMLNTCNPNVIKIYIFLKYKYFCFKDKFEFTDKMLLNECFGLSSNTNKKTNDELKDRLDILKKLGLIDWYEYSKTLDNGIVTPIKRLKFVNCAIKVD